MEGEAKALEAPGILFTGNGLTPSLVATWFFALVWVSSAKMVDAICFVVSSPW